jgi:hypothetical protein
MCNNLLQKMSPDDKLIIHDVNSKAVENFVAASGARAEAAADAEDVVARSVCITVLELNDDFFIV